MPPTPSIDLGRVRPHHGDQRLGFEELVRQILMAAPPANCLALIHKGAGADGGVESLARLGGGAEWGYQSKFFPTTFGAQQIAQVRTSFRQALASYPDMVGWTLAIPKNLSGAGNPELRTQRRQWEAFVNSAVAEAAAQGRDVRIELWDETALIHQLSRLGPVWAGMRAYWFDETVLTPEWFVNRFEIAQADLGDRYHSEDHVDVSAQLALDTLSRGAGYTPLADALAPALRRARAAMEAFAPFVPASPAGYAAVDRFRTELVELEQEAVTLPLRAAARIDIRPHLNRIIALFRLPAQAVLQDAGYPPPGETGEEREARLQAGYDLREALADLEEAGRALPGQVLAEHRLLLVGEAGAGKSHSLAHLVEQHVRQGFPAVMLLGQTFFAGDPRAQILTHLSLTMDFGSFLGTMQAAAIAAGRPALIIIDAVNESRDRTLWRRTLAGLATEIEAFDHLALIISCRDVYETACVPQTLSIQRYTHRGFEGDGAAAAKAYLDRNGIDRPAAPFLDAEFTNPLFLTTCVRRLRAEGRTSFPTGLDGINTLFAFWIEGIEHSLVEQGYARITPGDGRVRQALDAFSDQLALEKAEALPYAAARALLERHVAGYVSAGPDDDLLSRLIAEGVLRRRPVGEDEDEVEFTFQRFSDHFIANAFLRLFDTPAVLAAALKPNGDLAYLSAQSWCHAGVMEALWVQAADTLSVELVELEPGFGEAVKLGLSGFLESLRWRSPDKITDRTVRLFESVWEKSPAQRSRLLETLLQVSSQPGHGLNAAYLHSRLAALPMPERDALLVENLRLDDADGPVEILLAWAGGARLDLADRERVALAASALTWFLSSPNRPLRDRTSRALTRVLRLWPSLIPELIEAVAPVDDPYIRERVLAAGYAALLYAGHTEPAQGEAAYAAWRSVFARSPVERHAFVRHYARSIIDWAAALGRLPEEIDPADLSPPYASAPIERWPAIGDIASLRDQARDIVSSVVGHYQEDKHRFTMPGDFGNYTMGSLGSQFTRSWLTEQPVTLGSVREAFWSGLKALPAPVPELADVALQARIASDAARRTSWSILDLETSARSHDAATDYKTADAAFDAAHEALMAALTPEDLPEGYLSYPGHDDDQWAPFGENRARRWVAARALELGWSATMHSELERLHSGRGGRHEHAVERIGKKYQWIAYHELIGHLADYHWHIEWREQLDVLPSVLAVEDYDIDLTYEGLNTSLIPGGLPEPGLRRTDFPVPASREDGNEWARSLADIPQLPELVETSDREGRRWWLVSSFRQDDGYMTKLQSDGLMRTGQGQIQQVIMRATDIEPLYRSALETNADLNELSEDGHGPNCLFGEYRDQLAPDRPLLDYRFLGYPIGRLSGQFSPDRGEYDFGGVKGGSFQVPRAPVLAGLGLRPAGSQAPWFVDRTDELVFVDWSVLKAGERSTMINADRLEPWLANQGLAAVWRYWGEKDAGMGSGRGFSRQNAESLRETFAGFWWKANGQWRGSCWRATGRRVRRDSR